MADLTKKDYKRDKANTSSPASKGTFPRPKATEASAPKQAMSAYMRKKTTERIRQRLRGGSSY